MNQYTEYIESFAGELVMALAALVILIRLPFALIRIIFATIWHFWKSHAHVRRRA